jgi:eukaryotic translation initiation factor 2C
MKNQQVIPHAGSWNMKEFKFAQGAKLAKWNWALLRKGMGPWSTPTAFAAETASVAQKLRALGMNVEPKAEPWLRLDLPNGDVEAFIEEKFTEYHKQMTPHCLIVVLPYSDSKLYNCVKKICDVRLGIHTVCLLAEKLAKPKNDQYVANVGLKLNLKLGGTNHQLSPSQLGIIAEGRTMLVGIDVTHPSPTSASDAPSIAGVVASVDAVLSQWPADIRVQLARQEMVADLDEMLKTRLQLWRRSNKNKLPENIIVYRDGVSEGQYDTVLEQELPLLKKACREVYPPDATKGRLPRISIIIVGKRHNTRFYATNQENADNSSNLKNGTIVDRGVSEARSWDFYLQAHAALQGTARPAHYFVVWDEIFRQRYSTDKTGYAADVLQALTHNLCYLFGRATKAVSVCPPAFYADLVCERARCYLSNMFDPSTEQLQTVASVGSGKNISQPRHDLVRIHPNLLNSMFYI